MTCCIRIHCSQEGDASLAAERQDAHLTVTSLFIKQWKIARSAPCSITIEQRYELVQIRVCFHQT